MVLKACGTTEARTDSTVFVRLFLNVGDVLMCVQCPSHGTDWVDVGYPLDIKLILDLLVAGCILLYKFNLFHRELTCSGYQKNVWGDAGYLRLCFPHLG